MTETGQEIHLSVIKWVSAAAGWAAAWWAGLPAIAQALLMVQAADVLTGVLCALTGKSPKSDSGRVSSKALSSGVLKKGLEWLAVCICVNVGGALEMAGIGGAAMTYMIATEMVSLIENLSIFGLDIPVLRRILDVAQGGQTQEDGKNG